MFVKAYIMQTLHIDTQVDRVQMCVESVLST